MLSDTISNFVNSIFITEFQIAKQIQTYLQALRRKYLYTLKSWNIIIASNKWPKFPFLLFGDKLIFFFNVFVSIY
jgi:hypothetical protein